MGHSLEMERNQYHPFSLEKKCEETIKIMIENKTIIRDNEMIIKCFLGHISTF